APVRLVRESAIFPGDRGALVTSADQLAPRAGARRIVIVNPSDAALVIPGVFIRSARGERIAAQTLALTYPDAPGRISRTSSRAIVVTPTGAQKFAFFVPRGLRPGDAVRLGDGTIRVTVLDGGGRPAEFVVTFDVPLDDPSFRWMRWTQSS